MASPLTDKEREQIAAAVRDGGKRNEVARQFGRSPGSITTVAKAFGLSFDRSATEKASQAQRDYDLTERLLLLNEVFDKGRDMLANVKDAREYQALVIAIATAIDKRRLEDGEATNRTEAVDPERRQKMRESLDEVATRRRAKLAG